MDRLLSAASDVSDQEEEEDVHGMHRGSSGNQSHGQSVGMVSVSFESPSPPPFSLVRSSNPPASCSSRTSSSSLANLLSDSIKSEGEEEEVDEQVHERQQQEQEEHQQQQQALVPPFLLKREHCGDEAMQVDEQNEPPKTRREEAQEAAEDEMETEKVFKMDPEPMEEDLPLGPEAASQALGDLVLEKLRGESQALIKRHLSELKAEENQSSGKRSKKGKQAKKGRTQTVSSEESTQQLCVLVQSLEQHLYQHFESNTVLVDGLRLVLTLLYTVEHSQEILTSFASPICAGAEAEDLLEQVLRRLQRAPGVYRLLLGVVERIFGYAALNPCNCNGEDFMNSLGAQLCDQANTFCAGVSLTDAHEWSWRWIWFWKWLGSLPGCGELVLQFAFNKVIGCLVAKGNEQNGSDENQEMVSWHLSVFGNVLECTSTNLTSILRGFFLDSKQIDSSRLMAFMQLLQASPLKMVSTMCEHVELLMAGEQENAAFVVAHQFLNDDAILSMVMQLLLTKPEVFARRLFYELLVCLEMLWDEEKEGGSSVENFHNRLLAFATGEQEQEQKASLVLLKGLSCQIQYLCERAVRECIEEGSHANSIHKTNGVDDDWKMSTSNSLSTSDRRRFSWKPWLQLLTKRLEMEQYVTHLAIELYLICQLETDGELLDQQDREICGLLLSLRSSISSPIVENRGVIAYRKHDEVLHQLLSMCEKCGSPGQQARLLSLSKTLWSVISMPSSSVSIMTGHEIVPIEVPCSFDDEQPPTSLPSLMMAAFAQAGHWKQECVIDAMHGQNRGNHGAMVGQSIWERVLDFVCSANEDVTAKALEFLVELPFISLENPLWQYRAVTKLLSGFGHLLARYHQTTIEQQEEVELKGPEAESRFEQALGTLGCQLETMKTILFRVINASGGVTCYPTSVYGVFIHLFTDFLLNPSSPTSIPTHFPDGKEPHSKASANNLAIRCERTISSKCTNLQASQVLLPSFSALTYRKPLDSLWEIEMRSAQLTSVHAVDVLHRLLACVPQEENEFRIQVLVDLLLERSLPCCGIPSDELYKEMLPNRSVYDVDSRIEQWLHHFPMLLPVLHAIVKYAPERSTQPGRLLPILKSCLVVLIGHWNSIKEERKTAVVVEASTSSSASTELNGQLRTQNPAVLSPFDKSGSSVKENAVVKKDVPPYMRNGNQLQLTGDLLRVLALTNWLPPQLPNAVALLHLVSPTDIRGILFSCWSFLSDFPPSSSGSSSAAMAHDAAVAKLSPSQVDFYLTPLRRALHDNIHGIGNQYVQFAG